MGTKFLTLTTIHGLVPWDVKRLQTSLYKGVHVCLRHGDAGHGPPATAANGYAPKPQPPRFSKPKRERGSVPTRTRAGIDATDPRESTQPPLIYDVELCVKRIADNMWMQKLDATIHDKNSIQVELTKVQAAKGKSNASVTLGQFPRRALAKSKPKANTNHKMSNVVNIVTE